MKRYALVSWILMASVLGVAGKDEGDGIQKFVYRDKETGKSIPVYYHAGSKSKDLKIMFIVHGYSRNASSYLERWIRYHPKRKEFLFIAPHFEKASFPDSRSFQCGNIRSSKGGINPKKEWTFMIIERLFDHVKQEFNQKAKGYYIYGHSAGGQFVHRFALTLPEARFIKAYPANPGWWTWPDLNIKYPYGLGGIGYTEQTLHAALKKDVVILLGDKDTDTNDPLLRKTPEAMAQGKHRFERGQNFHALVDKISKQSVTKTHWKVEVLKGVGHSNSQVARVGAKVVGY